LNFIVVDPNAKQPITKIHLIPLFCLYRIFYSFWLAHLMMKKTRSCTSSPPNPIGMIPAFFEDWFVGKENGLQAIFSRIRGLEIFCTKRIKILNSF
jgi:hypothetical protein